MDDGFNCLKGVDEKELLSLVREGWSLADFVLGDSPPTEGNAWVLGELKSSLKTLYDQYASGNSRQFQAFMAYAAHHTYPRTALLICAVKGQNAPSYAVVQEQVIAKGVKLGAVPMVVVIYDR